MKAAGKSIGFDVATGKQKVRDILVSFMNERDMTNQVEQSVVGIYPSYQFQTMEGYGCAMTETACYLLSQMDAEKRSEAIDAWFGKDGINASFVRIHIDSCDFSLSEYQAVEDPIADPELCTFNIDRDRKYIIPVMKEVLAAAGDNVSVLLSPWSPPAQWKTAPELSKNDAEVYGGMVSEVDFEKPSRCFGGRLKPEYYGPWAAYLVKFIQAYLKEGIPVTMLSIQNEASAATAWDSCLWSGEQEKTFLKEYLYPAMKKAGLTDTIGIYIWDHNKERMIEHIDEMMQDDIYDLIEGFAYHWYSGDHFEALTMMHEKYPGKILMHSESCGLHIPGKAIAFDLPFSTENINMIPEEMPANIPPFILESLRKNPFEVDFEDAMNYAHDMIGDINSYMNRWIDWNLIVDRTGGPRHVPGGFAAPIIYEDDGTFTKTISFYYIKLIAQTIRKGARRLGISRYGDDVELAAARNTDDSIGIVLLNKTNETRKVNLRMNGFVGEVILDPETLTGLTIERGVCRRTV